MPGLQPFINALTARKTQIESVFFAVYIGGLFLHYPISVESPLTIAGYGILPLVTLLYALADPAPWRVVFRDPIVCGFLALFAFIIMHALLLTPSAAGASKTSINALGTACFLLSSIVFMMQAGTPRMQRMLAGLSYLAGLCAAASIALHFSKVHTGEFVRLVPLGRAQHETLGALTYGLAGISALYVCSLRQSRAKLTAHVLSIIAITVMIVLTKSRMPIIVYGLCMVLGLLCFIDTARQRARISLAAALILAVPFLIPSLRDAIITTLSLALAKGDNMRFILWQATLEGIHAHPWIGNGMRAVLWEEPPNTPHNIYLATAYFIGIPAALGFIGLILCCAVQAMHMLRNTRLERWVALIFVQGACSGLTEHAQLVKAPGPVWLIVWLPIAFVIGCRLERITRSKPLNN